MQHIHFNVTKKTTGRNCFMLAMSMYGLLGRAYYCYHNAVSSQIQCLCRLTQRNQRKHQKMAKHYTPQTTQLPVKNLWILEIHCLLRFSF